MKQIQFNPIGHLSKMPKLPPTKTKKEIFREFEFETYKKILKQIKQIKNINIEKIEKLNKAFVGKSPFFYLNNFYLGTGKEKLKKTLSIYAKTINPHLESASALVELGAGYGSKILGLKNLLNSKNIPLYAFELTPSGRKIIELLSLKEKTKLFVGFCDLKNGQPRTLKIPKNSIIFTSYALHYLPITSLEKTFKYLCNQNPKIIIHFEPCLNNEKKLTLYKKMCNSYLLKNNYNPKILSFLIKKKQSKQIKLKFKRNIFGSNPLLPFSIIQWSKNNKKNTNI